VFLLIHCFSLVTTEEEEKRMKKILPFIVIGVLLATNVDGGQKQMGPEEWILEAERALANIDSYTAVFHKQERVRGWLKAEEVVFLKFKKPFRVYMRWLRDPGKGREIVYADGWNQNRIKVHEAWMRTGFSLNLDPLGAIAMGGSRHPITDSGLENFLRLLGRNLRKGIPSGEIMYRELGEEIVYGSRSRKIEYLFPREKTKGYYCYRAVINLGAESKLPIKARIYDWDGLLVEDYGYEDLKLNAGLTEADFDPGNAEYYFASFRTQDLPAETILNRKSLYEGKRR
jgi:outer membrane lipoprotein-sorting protein